MLHFNLSRKKAQAIGLGLLSVLSSFAVNAQTTTGNVGIGTDKPDKSALLDLTSTTRGLLIPRLTLVQRGNIQAPANGLLVYQTDFFSGFYFYDGSKWKMLYARTTDGIATNSAASDEDNTNVWNINGNTGLNPDFNYIGTRDTVNLSFRVNNYRSGLLDYKTLNTYFGYRAGYRARGQNSIALGAYALQDANTGNNNIAVGYASLTSNRLGNDNISIGANALMNNINGSKNIAIGSQAGMKSVGSGNIYIGNGSGMNETGSNKLFIDNESSLIPLIFGDFDANRVGINTRNPNSAFSIDSKVINISGLEFIQLKSSSPAGKAYGKVLSVDDNGKVILVEDAVGTGGGGGTAPSYWTITGSTINNSNDGIVGIKNGLVVNKGAVIFQQLEINSGAENQSGLMFTNLKSTSPTANSNSKVLSVDENGKVILVPDQVGTVTGLQVWASNGNNIYNSNSGNVLISNNLTFAKIKSTSQATPPNSKVLSVDADGNVILVPDQIGDAVAQQWIASGNDISNTNSGKVFAKNGLKIDLKSTSPVANSNAKVLSVDGDGNVILVSDQVGQSSASQWVQSGDDISNNNTGKVLINNDLAFAKIKSTSQTVPSNSKVLSVDENGKLILVPDQIGATVTQQWVATGNDISNANNGRVLVKNGLNFTGLSSASTPTIKSDKVLSVDSEGNVILVSNASDAGVSQTLPWKVEGTSMANTNTGGVVINSGAAHKSGLSFLNLKASSPTGNGYGKVLTLDDNGQVILVNDLQGSQLWYEADGRAHRDTKVVIGSGINSFPNGFNLFVKGGILTERVRVAIANSDRWADYVFRKDYKLMPLGLVEKYIEENQHLPNMPSADEMVRNGMDVSETSAKLLEKIEELMLYTIEQNKQIKELQSKVKALENDKK